MISAKTEKKDIVGRYIENTAHLSLTDSTIYATNCFVLKAKRVDAKNVLGEIKDILIPFDVLKNIGAGNCNFTVTEGEKTYNVVVKNTATDKVVSYSFKKIEKFLDYRSVFPKLYKEMNICLKDVKSFVDCIKTQQKLSKSFGLFYFMIQVIKGSKEIKVIACNEVDYTDDDHNFSEFSFELKESSEFSGNYFYRFNDVLKCLNDWNGNLYFDETKLSFGIKAVDTCFCIGVLDINKYFDKYSIVAIKPDKLTKIEIGTISGQNNDNVSLDNCDKQNKNHLDAIYKDTPKEGDYVEFNLSCNADAPTYADFISNDPDLGLICIVDGQKIEVRKMINLKVLKPEEGKTLRYVSKDGIKFTTWKYSACGYCFYLDKKTDIAKTLLLSNSDRMQGFFYKGYFVKNILKPQKQKFLPGNFYQFIYKLVYVGYKIENGKRLKMYQLKQMAFYPEVR